MLDINGFAGTNATTWRVRKDQYPFDLLAEYMEAGDLLLSELVVSSQGGRRERIEVPRPVDKRDWDLSNLCVLIRL